MNMPRNYRCIKKRRLLLTKCNLSEPGKKKKTTFTFFCNIRSFKIFFLLINQWSNEMFNIKLISKQEIAYWVVIRFFYSEVINLKFLLTPLAEDVSVIVWNK